MRPLFVLLASLWITACSHPAPPAAPAPTHVAPPWHGPEILALVPADTPYLFGMIEPTSPELRARMMAQTGDELEQTLKKLASGEGRGALVAAALYSELDGATPGQWMEKLGMSSDARFVIYGLSVWPVARIEIKDDVRVRELLARAVKAGDPDLQPRSVGRAMMYELDGKGFAVVFGVVDHELVAAVIPTSLVGSALPAIVGTELPAKSLRDAPVLPAMLAKHHFVPGTAGFIDMHRIVEAVSAHGQGQYDQLDSLFATIVPSGCQDDFARIAAVLPRLVVGYTRLDMVGFGASMVIEVPRSVSASLAKLRAPMPAMPLKTQPLLAFGAAVNLDATIAWMKDTAGALHAAPFRCSGLSPLNEAIDKLANKLDQPLPPMAQGLRGFELVLDDATVLPPSGTGHLLVAGDHIADLVHGLLAKVPQLSSLQVPADGVPLELPLAALGVPSSIQSVHVALRPSRVVVTAGPDSAARASRRVSAPDAHAPLMTMSFDLPKLRERFGAFMNSPELQQLSNIESATFSLDVGDGGIALEMVGTWAHGR